MRYYLLQGSEVITLFDEKEAGHIALPLLETGKEMSLITEVVFKALMANLELTPQDAMAALSITDARKEAEKPTDDCLKAVAVVAPVEEEPIEPGDEGMQTV